MPVGEFFGVLRRRWLLVLIGVLLTGGLTGAAYMVSKPTYEITGTVLLLPPTSSADTGSANPYLMLGGLNQAVDLVGVALTDQTTQLEMQKVSKDVQYNVQADVRTSSPLLLIDVKDSSPETALMIRDVLVARVPLRLDVMQNTLGVASKDRVSTSVLTLDAEAVEVGKNRLRAAVVAGVAGLALTLVIAAMWDAHRVRHPRRRKTGGTRALDPNAPMPEPTPEPTPEPVLEPTPEPELLSEPEPTPEPELLNEPEPTPDPLNVTGSEPTTGSEPEPTTGAESLTEPEDVIDDPVETSVDAPVSPLSADTSLDALDLDELADAPDDAHR